jgi:hypothetical protein
MSTVKSLPASNGKKEEHKPAETSTPKTQPVSTLSVVIPERKETEKLSPLEDRLHRLNQLFELQGKYYKLQESLQKLKSFKFKKNGDYSSLSIRDNDRSEFNTGNQEVIEEVVKYLIIAIDKKMKEIEPLLKW